MDETLEVHELDSTEGLFDDYEPTSEELAEFNEESIEPQEEPEETTNETVEEETAPVEEPYGLKIKFNGEERTLTEEEARTLSQKGLNYDRFYEPLERLARMNNMSVGDYINQLNDTQMAYEVEKEKDNLRNDPKYENVDEEILEEIAQSRVSKSIGERDRSYESQVQQKADAEQEKLQRELDHLFEEYPELKDKSPDDIDQRVFEYVGKGYTLLEAYNKVQRLNAQKSQSEAKAKVSQLNEANKKKSLGNTTNAGKVESDDFLTGLFSS